MPQKKLRDRLKLYQQKGKKNITKSWANRSKKQKQKHIEKYITKNINIKFRKTKPNTISKKIISKNKIEIY